MVARVTKPAFYNQHSGKEEYYFFGIMVGIVAVLAVAITLGVVEVVAGAVM